MARAKEMHRQDWVNRQYMRDEEEQPQPRTFASGLEFIRTNHRRRQLVPHIETFDPARAVFHPAEIQGPLPARLRAARPLIGRRIARVTETPEQVRHIRYENAALLSMCDAYLGKVLDLMDELDLWKDTLLIVNTDHGFLLGEHDWWAKCGRRSTTRSPTRRSSSGTRAAARGRAPRVPGADHRPAPTLLEYFGVAVPPDMQGKPLGQTIAADAAVREAALFGIHGGQVNGTDGRYVYMRGPARPDNEPLYEYTLMPTHMRSPFGPEELQDIELAEPFSFTKGCRVMKIEPRRWVALCPGRDAALRSGRGSPAGTADPGPGDRRDDGGADAPADAGERCAAGAV